VDAVAEALADIRVLGVEGAMRKFHDI
jgi:hypothetical protein